MKLLKFKKLLIIVFLFSCFFALASSSYAQVVNKNVQDAIVANDLDSFKVLIVNVAEIMLGIVGSLALLMFVYGGVMMIISGGNQERTGKGKTILTNAVIGLVIVFTSWLIIYTVQKAFGIESKYQLESGKATVVLNKLV